MLKDGIKEVWQPQKVLEFNDGILLLENGEVDTKSDVFVGLTEEPKK